MLLYKFGAWKPLGSARVDASYGPRIGADPADIFAAIEKDGFFVFPASK
jgi:hypothetical protein